VGFETDPDMHLANPLQFVQVIVSLGTAKKVDELSSW